MSAIETQIRDAIVALYSGGLLEAGSKIIADFTEDAYLALDHFLVGTILHVTRNIANKALARALIPDALPEGTWGVEILRADLGKEGDGIARELAVGFVKVNGALPELDGLNGTEISKA